MRKTQVIAIHGGDPRVSEAEYIKGLKREQADADDFKSHSGWKDKLQERLGPAYEVFNPDMPRKENASYAEWKIWFEKLVPFLRPGAIFIGHSLGAIFLAKYLSENEYPKRAKAVFLVAAPWKEARGAKGDDGFGGFSHGADLSRIARQADVVALYHSTDDPVVPYPHMAKYEKAIPGAVAITLKGRKHIWKDEFPEIVEDIKFL